VKITQERAEMMARKHLSPPPPYARLKERRDIPMEELRDLHAMLLASCKRLIDKTKVDSRELTEEETVAFDEGMRLVEFWKHEIDRLDARGETVMRGGPLVGNTSRIDGKDNHDRPRRDVRRITFTDSKGNEVRSLSRDESIATGVTVNLPDGIRAEELSIGRLVRAAATGDWSKAQAEKRAMGGSSDILGGYLVPAPLAAGIIDLARNKARVFEAGAQTIPMVNSNSLTLAKLLSDVGVGWKTENQPGSFADATFGAITLEARTLMSLASMSIELVEDSANLDNVVQNSMGSAIALELDRACLRGDSGGASPTGIRNTPNIQTVDLGVNGAALTAAAGYSFWSQAVQKVWEKNGEANAAIFAPRTAGVLDRLLDGMNNPQRPPASFEALQKLVTNQIPITNTKGTATTASESYVADFTELLVGMRTDLTLELTRAAGDASGSAFTKLQLWMRMYLRADVALMRPEHFVLIDGIL
jgi:HK97 family phage major capsid protein